jgi:hypothetical protein
MSSASPFNTRTFLRFATMVTHIAAIRPPEVTRPLLWPMRTTTATTLPSSGKGEAVLGLSAGWAAGMS